MSVSIRLEFIRAKSFHNIQRRSQKGPSPLKIGELDHNNNCLQAVSVCKVKVLCSCSRVPSPNIVTPLNLPPLFRSLCTTTRRMCSWPTWSASGRFWSRTTSPSASSSATRRQSPTLSPSRTGCSSCSGSTTKCCKSHSRKHNVNVLSLHHKLD